ncbi:MAG: hypothetical protein ABWY12_04915 [Burkholderiales bacterium]
MKPRQTPSDGRAEAGIPDAYSRNSTSGGAKLGLAITKRILELHDTAIAGESTSKLGT